MHFTKMIFFTNLIRVSVPKAPDPACQGDFDGIVYQVEEPVDEAKMNEGK